MKKLKGSFISIQIILSVFFVVLTACGGVYWGSTIVENYKVTAVKMQLEAMDSALRAYSRSHKNINKSSVKYDDSAKKLKYDAVNIYPVNITEIGTIRTQQGYFSFDVDLSRFTYKTKTESNGDMKYELGVTVNGKYIMSPGSTNITK